MTPPDGHGPESPGEALYRALLRLYPGYFRRRHGEELVRAYRDRRAEERHRGAAGRVRLAVWLATDLARSVPAEWWRSVRRRGPEARAGEAGGAGHHEGGGDGMGMESFVRDLLFAARSLARRPGYTLAAAGTLAVGIAGATTMYGVVDGVVLAPLPYPDSERLVQLGTRYRGWDGLGSISPAELHGWSERLSSFEGVAGSRLQFLTLRRPEGPELLSGAGVSGSFFGILGVEAGRGRLFGPADDRPGAPPVAVLTHGAWEERWGADPDVVGSVVTLDGTPFTVTGVLPRGYVRPAALYHGDVEVYFPLRHVADDVSPSVIEESFLQAVGRLAQDVDIGSAREEIESVQARLLEELGHPSDSRSAGMASLHERTVGDFGSTLLPFLGAVVALLLVACANVANLALVRSVQRAREMEVRAALGAGRGRLARQILTESVLLALLGGVGGALGAYGGVAAFRRLSPPGIPRADEVVVDPAVLGFGLALALVTGLVFGLAPVLRVLRRGPSTTGRDGDRTVGGLREGRLRGALVAGEIAVALVLVAGAALLARSFAGLLRTDLGFQPAGAAFLVVQPEGEEYDEPDERVRLYRELKEVMEAHPAVSAVGGTSNLPLTGNESVRNVTIAGWESADETGEDVSYNRFVPGFFRAAGIEVVAGRIPDGSDPVGGTVPVVINRVMAERYWAGRPALGGRLHLGSRDAEGPTLEVVGVVGDARQLAPGRPPVPQLYLPYTHYPSGWQALVIRGEADAASLVTVAREAARTVAPGLPVRRAGTMEELLGDSVIRPRFYAVTLATFAAVSLLLAVVGVYATMAYAVRQRTRELGVRMALGADRGRVRRSVLARGVRLTAVGLGVGLGLSLVSTRLLEGLVYGVTPTDPATLAGSAALLGIAALAASWIPAARATRIDPVAALRTE